MEASLIGTEMRVQQRTDKYKAEFKELSMEAHKNTRFGDDLSVQDSMSKVAASTRIYLTDVSRLVFPEFQVKFENKNKKQVAGVDPQNDPY